MSISYFIVIIGILLAKIFGFARDIFFADAFGTTVESDIYFGIFGVVTLVFACVGMALSTLIIKNLNKPEMACDDERRAYVSFFIRRVSLAVTVITAILYIFGRRAVGLLLPDIPSEYVPLALKLWYTMLPSFLFVTVAYIVSGVLQNNRIFFIPSIVSVPYNVLIILSTLVKNPSVELAGAATTAGWLLHVIFQLPPFYKSGYRLFTCAGAKEQKVGVGEGALIFVSNMMFQLCFLIDKAFVSGNEGMVATVNYASGLFTTISGIFVIAMSSVVFPAISKNFGLGKEEYIRRLVRYMITFMAVIFVPYLLVVTLFGENIISLIYERGKFTEESTSAVAAAFVIYSFGILGYIAEELFNKVFYLASKYKFTVIGTVSVAAVKVAADMITVEKYGPYAAAVTTTLLLTAYGICALVFMRRVIGKYLNGAFLRDFGKVMAAGAAALAVYGLMTLLLPDFVNGKYTFAVAVAACGVVYIAVLAATGLISSLMEDIRHARDIGDDDGGKAEKTS